MGAKKKILHGHGPSNTNLGIFVCSFDVCRASQPFPTINYGLGPRNLWKESPKLSKLQECIPPTLKRDSQKNTNLLQPAARHMDVGKHLKKLERETA